MYRIFRLYANFRRIRRLPWCMAEIHSERRLFTGFVSAARMACTLMVSSVIAENGSPGDQENFQTDIRAVGETLQPLTHQPPGQWEKQSQSLSI